jgi:hypothetical protein
VIVPAGSATWGSALTITKGITLRGAGDDTTVITATASFGGYLGLINLAPTSDLPIRVTGFTLNGGGKSFTGINITSSTKLTKIRIDHNHILNTTSDAVTIDPAYAFGVIDNNFLEGLRTLGFGGAGSAEWAAEGDRAYGSSNNMYIEDNIINFKTFIAVNGGGGRYAFRYNTITKTVAAYYSLWDAHGNQGVLYQNTGTMLGEMYGNLIDVANAGGAYIDHRGGWILNYNNSVINAPSGYPNYFLREEYADDQMGSEYVMRPTNSYYFANFKNTNTLITLDSTMSAQGGAENCCKYAKEDWKQGHAYPHMPNYCARWTNDTNDNCWKSISNWTPASTVGGSTGEVEPNWSAQPHVVAAATVEGQTPNVIIDGQVTWYNMGTGTPITENVDYFIQKTGTFDGTGVTGGGVGCGTLANRPATCTPGVAYWATNQSCTDMTGMVGANPSTPISGTLYKCTATDTWTAYYQPYQYPHPLRDDVEDTTCTKIAAEAKIGTGAGAKMGTGAAHKLH